LLRRAAEFDPMSSFAVPMDGDDDDKHMKVGKVATSVTSLILKD